MTSVKTLRKCCECRAEEGSWDTQPVSVERAGVEAVGREETAGTEPEREGETAQKAGDNEKEEKESSGTTE